MSDLLRAGAAAVVVAVALVLVVGAAQAYAQEGGEGVGQFVVTKWGTVLKVGNRVVDRENYQSPAPGARTRDFRLYRVARVNGSQVWLEAEAEDIGGWVPRAQIMSLDRAIDYFTSQIKANPGSSSDYQSRAHIWVWKNECGKAVADFSEAIRIDPKSQATYYGRGGAWYLMQDHDKAIADFTEAIRIDPKYVWAYHARGLVWCLKGSFEKALADFDEAIRIDPKHARAHGNRAWLWATCPDATHRDGKRAVESATRACELTQWKVAYAIGALAAAEAEVGNFDAAVKHEEKALGRYKDEAEREQGRKRLALYRAKAPYRDGAPAR